MKGSLKFPVKSQKFY